MVLICQTARPDSDHSPSNPLETILLSSLRLGSAMENTTANTNTQKHPETRQLQQQHGCKVSQRRGLQMSFDAGKPGRISINIYIYHALRSLPVWDWVGLDSLNCYGYGSPHYCCTSSTKSTQNMQLPDIYFYRKWTMRAGRFWTILLSKHRSFGCTIVCPRIFISTQSSNLPLHLLQAPAHQVRLKAVVKVVKPVSVCPYQLCHPCGFEWT